MLNDATCFKQVYIVCGYTDLRSGIDTLASIVDARRITVPMYRIPCICFVDVSPTESKAWFGKKMDSFFYTNAWNKVSSYGQGMNLRCRQSPVSSFAGSWKD